MDEPVTEIVVKRGGRKFSADPKVVRVTLLTTPSIRMEWQAAADALTEGNLSILVRRAIMAYIAGPKA
jgi:hypothetical protein